jgi:soluble cytochrome b562
MHKYIHQQAANGRWQKFSVIEQMANIGSEVERAISWKEKGNVEDSKMAVDRGLELLDLTIDDVKNKTHLSELLRLRELFVDYFYYDNVFASEDTFWRNYFYDFNYAARVNLT